MPASIEQQQIFMRQALLLGQLGRRTAPPNPWAGCVVVQGDEVVGEGFHACPGAPHAEIMALRKAGKKAKGSTVYVTLEPCSHVGRTPPCVNAVIEAGVKKVVIPFLDPDPRVNGNGKKILEDAGIEVVVGVESERAQQLLGPYLFHRKTGLPYTVLKAATSLDGRLAARDGSSKWITGEAARRDVHELRADSQAILVGTGTAIKDRPLLTVRGVELQKMPLRVVLDAKGVIPTDSFLFDTQIAPTLVFTASEHRTKEWEELGIEWELVDLREGKLDLEQVLYSLGQRGILQLLVEGGSRLHAEFFAHGFVNRFVLYVGSCILGSGGKPLFDFAGPPTIDTAERLKLVGVKQFDQDVRLDYEKDKG